MNVIKLTDNAVCREVPTKSKKALSFMNSLPFVGHIDAVENGEIYGWALNVNELSEPVTVGVYANGVLVAEALSGYYRPDVAKALGCSGRNGFYVDVDSLCTVNRTSLIDVRFPDGERIDGGPLAYTVPVRRNQPRRPPLLFMHIPKTAGTAFREVVMRNYRQSEVMYVYGDPPGFPSTYLGAIPLQQRAKLRLVYGHYGYGVHCHMPEECEYAALIRNPLHRIWSHYLHLLRDGDPAVLDATTAKGIEEVLEARESVHLDNIYIRYFCGVEAAKLPPGSITQEIYEQARDNSRRPNVFARIQDDLTLAYDSLAHEFGWIRGLKCEHVNAAPTSGSVPNIKEIKAIQHYNHWDFKLYEDLLEKNMRSPRYLPPSLV